MAKKKFGLGILAMVLVLGFTVVGCGDNGGDDDGWKELFPDLSTSSPTQAALDVAGLTLQEFNQIVSAGGGGYKGWELDEYLYIVWTGRSVSNFNSTANVLEDLFDGTEREEDNGVHTAYGDEYLLFFSSVVYKDEYVSYPARLMYASLGEMDWD